MTILSMCHLAQFHLRVGRRGGHCYCELGKPLWSHTAPRHPADRKPKESHTRAQVGSRKESVPPSAWTESGRTSVLREVSSSRHRRSSQAYAWAAARVPRGSVRFT